MAKVTGPAFSVTAKGTLADAITYQNRPGGSAVYGYKKPKVPLTDRQLWQRDLIKWCVYEWQQMSAGEKAEWEEKAKGQGQSGYSYFIHQRRGYLFDPDVALYLPLFDKRLAGGQFLSMDSYGHLCTVTGATWGIQGRTFAGEDDYISIPHNAVFNFGTGDYALIAWIKPTAWASVGHSRIFSKVGVGVEYELRYDPSGNLIFALRDAINELTVIMLSGLSLNNWFLVAGVRASGSCTAYVNLTAGTPATITKDISNTGKLTIGNRDAGNRGMTGIIGDAWVMGDAPSLDELSQFYNSTKWRYGL